MTNCYRYGRISLMGRHKSEERFSIYQRPNGYFYIRWRDGNRAAESLKTKDPIIARDRAHRMAHGPEAKLPPMQHRSRPGLRSFREWVDQSKWWVWDECEYIRLRNLRAPESRPAVQRRYADDARRILEKHLLPFFGDKNVAAISVEDIDRYMLETALSRKTINNHLSILRVMLEFAKRRRLIQYNPFDQVEPLQIESKERGILTLSEAHEVLKPEHWTNRMYRLVNLTAATTGLRQGEILAIRSDALFSDHVVVKHSWDARLGLGPTKTKRVREIPIPPKTRTAIDELVTWEGFIFSQSGGMRPVGANRCTTALYTALEHAQIDVEGRGITFHSWRHWFVTQLRSLGVALHEVQAISGHSTEQMVDHYSHFSRETFREVMKAQERIVG